MVDSLEILLNNNVIKGFLGSKYCSRCLYVNTLNLQNKPMVFVLDHFKDEQMEA